MMAVPVGSRKSCRYCRIRCRGNGQRVLARSGLPGEGAVPVFTPGAKVPLAGLLLALPALAWMGLLASARAVYGRLRNGFYGAGDGPGAAGVPGVAAGAAAPRAPAGYRPPRWAGCRGWTGAPEVKTIRRKLGARRRRESPGPAAGHRHHAATRPDDLGFLYIDGHARVYFGTRDVQKMHLARMKHPGPGTEETWVTGQSGDPVLVVMAEPSASLAAQVKDLLPDLRRICGDGAQPVLCFDRGGWSGDLFAEITKAGSGLLTYRKNEAGKEAPQVADDAFTVMTWRGDDGRDRPYDVAQIPRHAHDRQRRAQGRGAGPAAGHPPRQGKAGTHPHHERQG